MKTYMKHLNPVKGGGKGGNQVNLFSLGFGKNNPTNTLYGLIVLFGSYETK